MTTATRKYLYANADEYSDLVGQPATGPCVTSGLPYSGTISAVLVPSDGHCDVRYRLTDTGATYSGGQPVEPIVHGTPRLAADGRS